MKQWLHSAVLVLAGLALARPRDGSAQCYAARAGSAYDFAPAGSTVFQTDFSGDAVGDFPAGLEMKSGALEIAQWQGQRALRASAPSAFVIPLPSPLPDRFSVELGVVNRNTKQVGAETVEIYGGRNPNNSQGHTRAIYGPIYWQVSGGGASASAQFAAADADVCIGQETTIRLSVDGDKLKFYADQRRLASVPNAKFQRGTGLVITLAGRDDDQNAVYLTSIRLSGGGAATPSIASTPATAPGSSTPTPTRATTTAVLTTTPDGTRGSTTSTTPATATTAQAPTGVRESDRVISGSGAGDTTPAPPAVAATGLTAISGYGNVWLKWQPAPNAVGYRIERWKPGGTESVTLTGGSVLPDGTGLLTKPEFVDTMFPPRGQPYTYQVYVYALATYYRDGSGNYYYPDPASEARVSAAPKDPNAGPSWAEETTQMTSIVGYADLHVHQMSNLGFGGRMLAGSAWGPPATALSDGAHGIAGANDYFAKAAGEEIHLEHASGYPDFRGWPRSSTFSHQQVYEAWLKRAVDGGLRLMVMYAVNNPVLCAAVERLNGSSSSQCDDMQMVQRQLDAAKAFEQHVDGQSGGPGQGWYRIVRSPSEARVAMRAGKLAVVLGTEVPALFGCSERASTCTDTLFIRRSLEALHAQGVRQVLPVHVFNNAFGGTSVASVMPALANYIWNGTHLSLQDCSASGVRFRLTSMIDPAIAALLAAGYSPPQAPSGGHCNSKGLTAAGGFLLRDMMRLRMMVDVDHMGQNTFRDAMRLLRQGGYPMVTSHLGFVPLSPDVAGEGRDKRYEANKVQWQVDSLAAAGGLFSVITRQGTVGEVGSAPSSTVANNCDNSVRTFAQAYLYAVRAVRQAGGTVNGLTAVAFGSDFNGFNKQPGPRFGSSGCDGNSAQALLQSPASKVLYPFNLPITGTRLGASQLGNRTWDINTDGLAHIGMYPDFVADLKNVGVSDADLKPLFYSAEAYVRLWERAEKYLPVTP